MPSMAAANVSSWDDQPLFMGSPGLTNGVARRQASHVMGFPGAPAVGTPGAMPGLSVFGIHIEEIPVTPRHPPPSPVRLTRPSQGSSPNLRPGQGGSPSPNLGPSASGAASPSPGPWATVGPTGGGSPNLGGRSRSANKIPRLSAEQVITQGIFQEPASAGGQGAVQQGKAQHGGAGAMHGAGQSPGVAGGKEHGPGLSPGAAGGRSPKPAMPRSSTGDFGPGRAREQPKEARDGARTGSPSRRPNAPKLPPAPGLQKTNPHKASPGHHSKASPGHPHKPSSPGHPSQARRASAPVAPVRHASPVNPKFSPAPFQVPEELEETQATAMADPANRPVLTPTPPPSSPGPNGDSALSANAAASENSVQQKRSTTPIKAEYSPAPFGDETQWEDTTVPELRPGNRSRAKKRPTTARAPTVFNATACSSSQQGKGNAHGRSVLKATTPLTSTPFSVPSSPARFSSPVRSGPPPAGSKAKDDVSTGWTTSASPSACTSPAQSAMLSVHSTPVCQPGRPPSCQIPATASAEPAVWAGASQGEPEARRDPAGAMPIAKVDSAGTRVSSDADTISRARVRDEATFSSQSDAALSSQSDAAFSSQSDAEMDLEAFKKTGVLSHARVAGRDGTTTGLKPTQADQDWPAPSTPRKSGGFMSFFGKLVRKDSTSGSVPQSPRLGTSGSTPHSPRLRAAIDPTQPEPMEEATASKGTARLERSSSWQARTGRGGSESPLRAAQPQGLLQEDAGLSDRARGFGFARSSSSNFTQSGKSGGGNGEPKLGFQERMEREQEFTTIECKLTQSTSGESISILKEVSSTSESSSSESSENERCNRFSGVRSSALGQGKGPKDLGPLDVKDYSTQKGMPGMGFSSGSSVRGTGSHGLHDEDRNAGWEMQLPPAFVGEFQLKRPISGRRNRIRSMSSCSARGKAESEDQTGLECNHNTRMLLLANVVAVSSET